MAPPPGILDGMAQPPYPIKLLDGALLLDLWVVPGASRTELKGFHDGAVRLRVAAPPTGGQANRSIVRFLSQRLNCGVKIVGGAGGRRKQVRIDSADLPTIARALGIEPH